MAGRHPPAYPTAWRRGARRHAPPLRWSPCALTPNPRPTHPAPPHISTPEQRAAVAAQVARLAALGTPGPPPAPGSRWVTLYTTASGPAAGALGPLHGRTRQIIDASGTPTFVNTLDVFGLRATTDGAWSVRRPDRLDLTFGSTEFAFLGGLIKQRKAGGVGGGSWAGRWAAGGSPAAHERLGGAARQRAPCHPPSTSTPPLPPTSQVYDPPLKGHYRLIYGDSRLRVFETNKLSVFVLVADE